MPRLFTAVIAVGCATALSLPCCRCHLMRRSAVAVMLSPEPPPLPSEVPSREGTHSRKLQGRNGEYIGRDVVPLWVADMDFKAAQPIVEAVTTVATHGIYGYTDPSDALVESVLSRLVSLYGCAEPPRPEWLRWLPGLVCGLHHAVRASCGEAASTARGEAPPVVVVPTPVYPPFLGAVAPNGAELASVPLRCEARGAELAFSVEWDALEARLASPATKLLHWCNPHNPTGRCWSEAELTRVAELCVEHGVDLCSDEVWGEVPLDEAAAPFVSMLSLLPTADGPGGVAGLRERLVVLISPSKCFNVATCDIAIAVVPDDSLRARFRRRGADAAEVPPFGFAAAEAAYGADESEAWRSRLLDYLRANRDHAAATLQSLGMRTTVPEASYLMWIEAPVAVGDAAAFFLEHGVGLTGAAPFGGAPHCCRLNFGCSRATLDEGLARMAAALQALGD